MLPSIIIFCFLLFISNDCLCSNINIVPERVLLNTTSTTKLLCTKGKDDNRSFEVHLFPNDSSEYVQMWTNLLSNTRIEIIIQSLDYVGKFYLLCSSKGDGNPGTYSELIIGKRPGVLYRAEPCIVYYNRYIDCIIQAPTMVQAIQNRLNYNFTFEERRLPSHSLIYQRNPKLIKSDKISNTLTFRWYPQDPGHFPPDLRMNIRATIIDFGTDSHIMDMTPIFRISSNFTVTNITSTDLQIEFPNEHLFCHGNLTRDDESDRSNEKGNLRTFVESEQKIIRVTGLHANTWYRLCFHCRYDASVQTISDVQCHRYKTLTDWSLLMIIMIILISVVFVIIAVMLIVKYIRNRNTQRSPSEQSVRILNTNTPEHIELQPLGPFANQRISQ